MAILQIIAGLSYPLLIYLALDHLPARQVALAMLALVALRALLLGPSRFARYARAAWAPIAGVGAVAGAAAWTGSERALLLAPALVSVALLAVFGASLAAQPMIERFARLQVSDLGADEVAYCRRVTQVWCGFFLANAVASLALALHGNREWWAGYTGFAAYLLIGLLLAGEYVYRHWRFRRYLGGPFDALLMRCFPAPPGRGLAPELIADRMADGRWERELVVPETLACWPGHFESFPLVPGVVQLGWVMALIEDRLGRPASVSALEALKFRRPLRAGQKVTLELALERAPRVFSFRLLAGEEIYASGSIVMAAEATS